MFDFLLLKSFFLDESPRFTFIKTFYEFCTIFKQLKENPISPANTFTCSKLAIETLEKGVKHVQSYQ